MLICVFYRYGTDNNKEIDWPIFQRRFSYMRPSNQIGVNLQVSYNSAGNKIIFTNIIEYLETANAFALKP